MMAATSTAAAGVSDPVAAAAAVAASVVTTRTTTVNVVGRSLHNKDVVDRNAVVASYRLSNGVQKVRAAL